MPKSFDDAIYGLPFESYQLFFKTSPPLVFFVVEKETQTYRLRMIYGEWWRDLSLLLQLMTLPFLASFFLALE